MNKLVETPGIYELARESLDSAKGDELRALILMSARVRTDPMLFDCVVQIACKTCLDSIRIADNRRAWIDSATERSAAIDLTQRGMRARALIGEGARLLMDLRLPNGTRLGEAKRPDLDDAIDFYTKRIATEAHKVRWFKAIARRIGNDPVERVLKEKDIRKLQADCEDE